MAEATKTQDGSRFGLIAVPGIVASALPVLACSLCWPAYGALLSSLGLGFIGSSRFLLPMTAVLLAVAVIGLGLEARSKGLGPLVLALVSTAMIVPGKFSLNSYAMTYSGAALLTAASMWRIAANRRADSASCDTCQTASGSKPESA